MLNIIYENAINHRKNTLHTTEHNILFWFPLSLLRSHLLARIGTVGFSQVARCRERLAAPTVPTWSTAAGEHRATVSVPAGASARLAQSLPPGKEHL